MKQEVQTEEKRKAWLPGLCIKSGSYLMNLDTTRKVGRREERTGACTMVGTGERAAFQGFCQSTFIPATLLGAGTIQGLEIQK